uniref:Toxin n=1 Tax=Tolypothrix bouteillei VB521301 TaxID=1479485 RepID=A0A0C1N6R0_9CYAN
MSSNESETNNVEPPEVKLTAPNLSDSEKTEESTIDIDLSEKWLVVAKNRRVYREWEALTNRYPQNCYRCYQDLCTSPTTRKQGCVFPLKGKAYKGVWEYEVASGDRVYYIPNTEKLKVIIYYAGKHISPAPKP